MKRGWMRLIQVFLAGMLVMAMGVSPVFAGGTCTKEDVKKAVDYAVDLVNAKGGEAAFPELEKYRFCGEEGYIWVSDFEGLMLMHPVSKKLVGVNQAALQDPTGKYFYAEFLAKVKKDGEGWVSYQWLNPATKKLDPKCSYVKATKVSINGKKVWCGAGIYGINQDVCK
jgi:signal transduction histidine kinase